MTVLVTNAAGKPRRWRPDPDRIRRRHFRRMERRLLGMLRAVGPAAGGEHGALADLLRQARLGAEVLATWLEGKGG